MDNVNPAGFDELISEIERLDGQALRIRKNRPLGWNETVRRIREDVQAARSLDDLDRAFRKLDLAYPNRHASYDFSHELPMNRLVPTARFAVEWIHPNKVQLRISHVDDDFESLPQLKPAIGDLVIGIIWTANTSLVRRGVLFLQIPVEGTVRDGVRRKFPHATVFLEPINTSLLFARFQCGNEPFDVTCEHKPSVYES